MKLSVNNLADPLKTDGFVAYSLKCSHDLVRYTGREHFHKIALISGQGEIHYNERVYKIDGSVILMTTPGISCYWQLAKQSGPIYLITFTDDFIKRDCEEWADACVTYFRANPVFQVLPAEEGFMKSIFCKMVDDQITSYSFKEELFRDQICVISHVAFQKKPVESFSSIEISSVSSAMAIRLEFVERQFPAAAQILHLN